jgi:pyridoxamine 5'-phosphate oxidase
MHDTDGNPAPPAPYEDLASVRRDALALIADGVLDRHSPCHTPVLVTVGTDRFPAARTVVLRALEAATPALLLHTNHRSAKITEIGANPRVAVVFYNPGRKIQIRVAGIAAVHAGDAVARAAWQRLSAFSRRAYLGMPPGTSSPTPTSGLPAPLAERAPTPEEAEGGSANFAVIEVTVGRLDWLYLAAHGHQRAALTWEGGKERGEWLTP